MKKYLQSLLLPCILLLCATNVHAQSKLIHYWHFNNFTSVSGYAGLPSVTTATVNAANPYRVHADYSSIDTSKAKIVYQTSAGTSSAFSTTLDYANPGDTANARLGHKSDTSIISYALRPRNRSDSMELRFYIPTTHYKNILVKYESQSSSVTSGPLHQVFDYSTDSGATWKTTGLSVASDSAGLAFGPVFPVSFTTDTTVNNNPKLVFRIKFVGNSSGTSGNNRFDNVTVEGDTILPVTTGGGGDTAHVLVHYWNFNNFTTVYHNPNIPAMKADYSVLDTNITALVYKLLPGTSSAYAGYIDNYPVTPADNDINGRTIAGTPTPDGNAYRFRNPTDSAYLLLYMPSINYKNLVVKYAVMASSFSSGMLRNLYSYSTDSGATWKTSGLSIASDTTTLTFSLKTIVINDTEAYNNPRLVFKITPQGNTSASSGNNRLDNITLDGVVIDTAFHYHPGHGTAVPAVNALANEYTLYPNPANSTVYINTPAAGNKMIAIYNVTGQRVYFATTQDKLVMVNVAGMSNGMYYVNVRTENGQVYTMKFVKN